VGAIISIVAAYGYQMVARVANIAAPWMVLVFVAFGLVSLQRLGVDSLNGAWRMAKERILVGGDPLPGQPTFTFWLVTFFAWFCNMAMHVGMADLSVFRFARKSWYGIAAGAGMFLGHYVAWIAAALMYAEQLNRTPNDTAVLPGPLAYQATGIAGLVCVIVAGWTTANPTIYRAGLAFQAIVPRASRFTVTLFTGAVATAAGLFPAITMKLLNFVALYGLLLMPMGAVLFVDFWLIRRLGLEDNYAERKGISFNWAAALAWLLALAACVLIIFLDDLTLWAESQGWIDVSDRAERLLHDWAQIYFVSLPGWFIAAGLYIVLSRFYQKRAVLSDRAGD
jgi:purine-cytosine permease-like protein